MSAIPPQPTPAFAALPQNERVSKTDPFHRFTRRRPGSEQSRPALRSPAPPRKNSVAESSIWQREWNKAHKSTVPRVKIPNIPWRVSFYSFDLRERRHVHVFRERMECKVWIENNIEVAWNRGFAGSVAGCRKR